MPKREQAGKIRNERRERIIRHEKYVIVGASLPTKVVRNVISPFLPLVKVSHGESVGKFVVVGLDRRHLCCIISHIESQ